MTIQQQIWPANTINSFELNPHQSRKNLAVSDKLQAHRDIKREKAEKDMRGWRMEENGRVLNVHKI